MNAYSLQFSIIQAAYLNHLTLSLKLLYHVVQHFKKDLLTYITMEKLSAMNKNKTSKFGHHLPPMYTRTSPKDKLHNQSLSTKLKHLQKTNLGLQMLIQQPFFAHLPLYSLSTHHPNNHHVHVIYCPICYTLHPPLTHYKVQRICKHELMKTCGFRHWTLLPIKKDGKLQHLKARIDCVQFDDIPHKQQAGVKV